jgi:hypothetical protein
MEEDKTTPLTGEVIKVKKPRNKKPDLNTKVGKYFMAKVNGKTKKEAQEIAGYSTPTHSHEIENSKQYQAIEQAYFKDVLLKKIGMKEIAEALVDNIQQTGESDIDRGARNKAIEIALNKIEPNDSPEDIDDKVLVIIQ